MIDNFKQKIMGNKIFKNIMILFKGNMLVSIVSLVNTALLVRAVGLEKNGIIFMAQSYALMFNTLFNFQSYNAIVMFIPKVTKDKTRRIGEYIKQGFLLDFSTAFFGIIVAFACVVPVAKIMHWDKMVVNCVLIYIIVILFKTTGTMGGILRIHDKFKESVYINMIEVASKLILLLIGMGLKYGIYYYVIVEVVTNGFAMLAYIWYTYKVVKSEKIVFRKAKLKFDKEFIKFNFYSNLETTVDMPIIQLTPFIINSMLGFSDIAIFKIIEKLGAVISKVTTPITQAIFPDISKRIAENNIEGAMNIHRKAKKLIGLFGIAMIIASTITSPLWLWVLLPVTPLNVATLAVYLCYIVFTNMFMVIHPIFTFLGYIKKNIPIVLVANLIYLVILVALTKQIGIIGVIISQIIQAALVIASKEYTLKKNNYKEMQI